ncbi:rod shape-determining protein MreD [Nocardioides dongxiaopingii]|uniref:rod shape-determining protein MreD n=1 Tax=Nocardioides TaxID=1839 RepID=UPI0010C76428|nr:MULTISPECIES: rod shape-determining protein MreD [Nocardioides]QCW49985.1 rod shape-determining protein MreD [Nocardioides sp. S-1144]
MTGLSTVRVAFVALAAAVALVLQTTVFPHLAWHGVGPNVVLLVVVAAGLARGAHFGMVLGFGAGLLLDLAPPADHAAGRWALALLVVGYVAGRVRQDAPAGVGGALAAVAACSFLGSSLFALTGLLLDPGAGVPDLLEVVLAGVVWDLVLAAFVVPVVMRALTRLDPAALAT